MIHEYSGDQQRSRSTAGKDDANGCLGACGFWITDGRSMPTDRVVVEYVYGRRDTGQLCVYIRRWLFPWVKQGFNEIDLADFQGVAHGPCTVSRAGTDTPSASSNHVYALTKTGKRLGLASGPIFTEASAEEISTIVESWVRQA